MKDVSYEELKQRIKDLIDAREEEFNLAEINDELSALNRQLRESTGLMNRIEGKEIQSRVYVTEISDLGRLQNGMTHDDPTFPLETTCKGRILVLKYLPFGTSEEFYKFLGKLERIDGVKKQKCKKPRINFEPVFSMRDSDKWSLHHPNAEWNYDVFYLDELTKAPSTLRAGKAVTYHPRSFQREIMDRVKIPGQYEFPGGCHQDPDGPWIPEHWEYKRTGKYETVNVDKPGILFPMAILSAGSSKDLDNLEKRIGLVK
ncbi:hypothetical protein JW756_02575 [Candidatus Woesearchaeota archaeon]|nr:hypothetical protein [Candidatus Woesearchaeota archaeon]